MRRLFNILHRRLIRFTSAEQLLSMPSNNVIPLPEPEDDLQDQALRWVVRLNSGEVTQGDRQAFTLWVQQNRKHRQAYFAARRFWRQMGNLDLPAVENLPGGQSGITSETERKKVSRRLAAGFAIILMLAVSFLSRPFLMRHFIADYSTGIGEIKTLHLADGSTVYLNTDTLITEHYSPEHRAIELLAGEAEFHVAHDTGRPFVVTAGDGHTRALGTRFVVKYLDGKARVSVLEHAVEISSENHASVTLNSGYKIDYGDQGLLNVPTAIVPSETNAWRGGKLKFNARPLREVVAEIDRYLPGKILLVNDDLADHQVTGVFGIENLDRAITVIAKTLHMQTAEFGSLLYVMY